jgi:hypothetical protein
VSRRPGAEIPGGSFSTKPSVLEMKNRTKRLSPNQTMFFKSSRNLVTFLSTACNVSTAVFDLRFVTVNLHFPDNSASCPESNSFLEVQLQKGLAHVTL